MGIEHLFLERFPATRLWTILDWHRLTTSSIDARCSPEVCKYANPMILTSLGQGLSLGLCSRQAPLDLFLAIFQIALNYGLLESDLLVIDLILEVVASSCDSPTDFTLWASREVCPVTEYVNKFLLKMNPKSPLAPFHGNNGTVLMRENGEGVTGISSPFSWFLEENPTPSSGLWQIKPISSVPWTWKSGN